MLITDKKPKQLREGHIINWVSIDSVEHVYSSCHVIFSTYPKLKQMVEKHIEKETDLMGTVLTANTGPIKIHNVFVSKTIEGEMLVNPFACVTGLVNVFELLKVDTKPKCFISQIDDSVIWDSLRTPIERLESGNKLELWEWKV